MKQFKLIYLARRNPVISEEDWPRTWRSHAVFASQFPVIGASLSSLFYCARIPRPMRQGVPFEPPDVARDYDGAAIVSGPKPVRVEMAPQMRAKIDQDELRVFRTLTPEFSFHCREVLVLGGDPGSVAIIRFLARKAGTQREDFLTSWNRSHAAITTRAMDAGDTITRYVHNALTEEPPSGYPFDGISETWFATADDAIGSLVDGTLSSAARDLAAFCDVERSVTLLTHVIHRWPRLK